MQSIVWPRWHFTAGLLQNPAVAGSGIQIGLRFAKLLRRGPRPVSSHVDLLLTSFRSHHHAEEVRAKIRQAIGSHEDLLTIVKRRKLQWYGQVFRTSGLAKTILQGTVTGGKKTRQTEEKVGRQHQRTNRPGVRQVPWARAVDVLLSCRGHASSRCFVVV